MVVDKATIKQSPAVKDEASATDMAARPFQCEDCPKNFRRKTDLQRHFRIHTNERPYACDYKPCSKTFIQRGALTVHRRVHTGDKPHKCPFTGCGKCFSDSSSLARHRRLHTNLKPYICKDQGCKKAFYRKQSMTESIQEGQNIEYVSEKEELEGDTEKDKHPYQEPTVRYIRADITPDGLPKASVSVDMPTLYQLRNNDMSIWSLQNSSTSLTHSSPISAIAHPLFVSYQFQQVSIPDYQQTVGNLEQQFQLHQYGGLQQDVSQQDLYTDMSRAPQRQSYNGTQAQTVTQHYQSDMPPTPVPTQSMPQYTTPVQEVPYQPYFSPYINGLYQYNDGMDWWKEELHSRNT